MAIIKLDCWKLICIQPWIFGRHDFVDLCLAFLIAWIQRGWKWVDLCSSHVMPQLNQQFWLISCINLESIAMHFIDSLFLCTFYDYFVIALYRDGSNIHTLFLHRSNFKSKGNCDCLNVGNLKINLRWRNCKWRHINVNYVH